MKKGKRYWPNLNYVQGFFKSRMDDPRLPEYTRDWYKKIYYRLLWHEHDIEDLIEEVLEQGIRNPTLPEDVAGWLYDDDDDFEDDPFGGNKQDEED